MKRATITQAKNQLSALIDQVRAGESVLILDRGIPVARLEPVSGQPDQSGRLERLERAGLVRRPLGPPPTAFSADAPALPGGVSAVAALIEERRSGR
jgi:prevent-host-death family protein